MTKYEFNAKIRFVLYSSHIGGIRILQQHSGYGASRALGSKKSIWNIHVSVSVFQQDAEWARVTTTTTTYLCRAVIVTCPPHLAGQCPLPASIDSPNENLTEAGGKYAPVSPCWSHMKNKVCLCCGWSKSWEIRSVGWGITWIGLWSGAGVKANTLSGG